MANLKTADDLGEHLRDLRKARGWSLLEVERRSDGRLRSSHLSQIETGKVREPSLSVLREYARVFGLSFRSLLTLLQIVDDDARLSGPEHAALGLLRDLDPTERDEALRYLKYLAQHSQRDRGETDDAHA